MYATNAGHPLSAQRLAKLAFPTHPVRMVLDTDTYNEIDDQFAVTYALLSQDKLTCTRTSTPLACCSTAGCPSCSFPAWA